MQNLAASYRLVGNHRAAFRWFLRAAGGGDGDALVEVGYAYLVALGVRRDVARSERAYRAAIESRAITPFAREEAMYGLASLLLLARPIAAIGEARTLLRHANADGDYPQAQRLLADLAEAPRAAICLCRRELLRRIARLGCPVHRRPGRLSRPRTAGCLPGTARAGSRR